MKDINPIDLLVDDITKHSIELQRLSNGTADVVLKKRYSKLSQQLTRYATEHNLGELSKTGTVKSQQKTLKALISNASKEIDSTHKKIYRDMQDTLREVGELETNFSRNSINRAVTGKGSNLFAEHIASDRKISKHADSMIIQGAPQKELWSRHSKGMQNKFKDIIRNAYVSGEDMSTTVGKISGTRGGKFKDGLMRTTYNHGNTLARTSILSMSNAIRQETYEANKDVLRGMEFLAHLDRRTTVICKAHSGNKWVWMPNGILKNIEGGHDFAEPPLHFNCRSTLIPIVKSAASLGVADRLKKKLDKVPKDRLKKLGETVPPNKYNNADAWLKTQPTDYQKSVLGNAHALWEAGKVSFQRFVSQSGKVRTAEQIAKSYAKVDLVPETILKLKTVEKFKPFKGASKQYADEVSSMEKGKFLNVEERLMTGKSVSRTQSDEIGRIIQNVDPIELEYAAKYSPQTFEHFVGNRGKRLAYYNHTAKRFTRFDKLAKGDLSKRSTARLGETDDLVKKELIAKIMADPKILPSRKTILVDMFEESSKIVGTQRAIPMTESLLTLSRKKDFDDITGDFVGYLQRAQENAVNSYFSRVKRLEIRLGQGVEKELRYSVLSNAAKDRQLSSLKPDSNSLGEANAVKKKISKIGSRKLRNYSGTTIDELSVNLELSPNATITNYLSNIDQTRMSNKQVGDWVNRMMNKKQQIVSSRMTAGEPVLISDKFMNLKEFKSWKDNAWSGRGFPPKIRDEAGEVLGDVQTYQDLRVYMRGKIVAPKSAIERGITADEYIESVLREYLLKTNRITLEADKFVANRKINNLYKLDGESRGLLRKARADKAKRELEGSMWARFTRSEARKADTTSLATTREMTKEALEKEADFIYIKKVSEEISKGVNKDILSPTGEFFREAMTIRRDDFLKVSRLTNQEVFAGVNKGGSYTDITKKLGEKYYYQFKAIREVDEDKAIRMGNFLLVRMEKAGLIERFKSTSMVREFDWVAPKESTMWMIKPKNPNWEKAILSNKKNYEFDGLPSLKPLEYDRNGFYENGGAAIRGTKKDEVEKMLGRSSKPSINNLDYEAATGIRVNNYVLDVQTNMERRGVGIGEVIPIKSKSKLDISSRSERQAWDSKRAIAKGLKDDVFYNGMSNDKYARTYSTNLGLQWQGDHVSKGLMKFNKGVKLGKYGEDAFKQEFINVSLNGFDKLPIKVRKQVYDLIPDKMIRDVIKDPLKNDWWYKKTDWFEAGLLKKELKGIDPTWAKEIRVLATQGKPDGAWNFLSLLKERQEMIAWKKRGKKIEDFVSYKQIQVDGTTNVLQHLSGISRDAAMADKVNMVVRPKVADAYIAVRDQLDDIARKLNSNDPRKKYIDQDLLKLAHSERRKSVKKGLMTYQYNAGPATLGDSYFEALEGVLVNGKPIFKTASKSDRLAVGRLIAQASDDVFPNSGNVKKLLNNFAEAHEIAGKKSIEFKTELGFPFKQQYNKKGVRQLELPDGSGGTMKINLSVDLDDIDWSKQNRAFAPNIIHAMDATHKSMVVNKLKEKYGVTNFSMIHDSFGSSAGHMKALNQVTRETFQELYKDRVFMKELYDSFSKQGVPMMRFVRNESGMKTRYIQGTNLVGKQERFVRDGRQWIVEPIPLKEVMDQGDFDFKDFERLEYFFH